MRLSPQPLVFGRFASVWPVSRSFCKRLLEPGTCSHAFTRGFLFLRFRCVFVPSSHDRQFRVSTCINTTMAIVYRSLNCEPRTWLCYRTSNGCVNRMTLFPWPPHHELHVGSDLPNKRRPSAAQLFLPSTMPLHSRIAA